jgi:hypothetical protein
MNIIKTEPANGLVLLTRIYNEHIGSSRYLFIEWAFRSSLFCRDYFLAPWEI